jgi:hypothetical protein
VRRRPLGEGCSSILVENGCRYTMYRNGAAEHVIPADAGSTPATHIRRQC